MSWPSSSADAYRRPGSLRSAIIAMASRSPRRRRRRRSGVVPRAALTCAGEISMLSPSGRVTTSALSTRVLGRSGSSSQIARATSAGERPSSRYGRWPHSSSYSSAPSVYTSLTVLSASPRTCSGLAYSGVMIRWSVRVTGAVTPESEGFSSFAMPKSSSFTCPDSVTRMLLGFRSRWMTRFWCA